MSHAARSSAARILIASGDMFLAQLRKEVLEQHFPGLEAVCTRNRQHALALLQSEMFHVLFLCSSLTAKARVEYAGLYRERNPSGKVMASQGREPDAFACDAFLLIPGGPAELLQEMTELLRSVEGSGGVRPK